MAYARKHQQLGGLERPGAQDNLFRGTRSLEGAVVLELHRPRLLLRSEYDAVGARACEHGEVRALAGILDERHIRASPSLAFVGHPFVADGVAHVAVV